MKSLMLLWMQALKELGAWCHTSTTRDAKTAARRFEHEGDSFLTITLPNFCVDLQKGLDQGFVGHDQFSAFAKSGGLPRFLGGFLDLVFNRGDGKLLDEPNIDALRALRQLTLMFGKVKIPCSEVRERKAIDAYVQCEKEVREADRRLSSVDLNDYTRLGRLLFGQLFSDWDLAVFRNDILPKHGPGSTADRLHGNSKWNQREWTTRLESIIPMGEHLLPSWRYWQELNRIELLEPGAERPVRVITVPKTLKTPRIIAIEPTAMQYSQQALLRCFLELWRRDPLLHDMLGFDDQRPNQLMAQQGSLDGSLATLDLSEASDRVSNQHVRALVQNHPWLARAVDATRSRKADVPRHGVIRLAKFASMGSALCFPFEAMVFLTVVLLGIERRLSTRLTRRDIESLRGQVRIFGDDILVPGDYVSSVVDCLDTFGFKVNVRKSYWTGRFRESCGADFYAGKPVKVVRVRELLPEKDWQRNSKDVPRQKHVDRVLSTVSLRNQLFEQGLTDTCQWIDDWMQVVLKGHYPVVEKTSNVLGRINYPGDSVPERVCDRLHRPQVKGYVVKSRLPVSELGGIGALNKVFRYEGAEPLSEDHLERAGRAESVDIKLGWAYTY